MHPSTLTACFKKVIAKWDADTAAREAAETEHPNLLPPETREEIGEEMRASGGLHRRVLEKNQALCRSEARAYAASLSQAHLRQKIMQHQDPALQVTRRTILHDISGPNLNRSRE